MKDKAGIISTLLLIISIALYYAFKDKFHLLSASGLLAVIAGLTLLVYLMEILYLNNEKRIKKYRGQMILGYCLFGLGMLVTLVLIIYAETNIKSVIKKEPDYMIYKGIGIIAIPVVFSIWRIIVISGMKAEKTDERKIDD